MNTRNLLKTLGTLFATGAALAGCGPQAYVVTSTTQRQQAPGSVTAPPKVDFLLVEDDTGSIGPAYSQIASQMPGFLQSLQAQNWDYHFATIPLTTQYSFALTQATASQYDANYVGLSQWLSPYPGAVPNLSTSIASSIFQTPANYTGFITEDELNNSTDGLEPGLETIRKAFAQRMSGTGFLRSDALTVILIVGNGDDTSNVNLCTFNGNTYPCDKLGKPQCSNPNPPYPAGCSSGALSLNYYLGQFQAIHPGYPAQTKVFAAVAQQYSNSCLGQTNVWPGTRYLSLASSTGGAAYDVCSQSISSVLTSLQSTLQGVQVDFETRYLFIAQDADPASIVVTKYLGGDTSQPVSIAQDATNGWTYDGYLSNVYTIDAPSPMNLASGYAIELHGSAKLLGNDTADVSYKPAGAQNSVSE